MSGENRSDLAKGIVPWWREGPTTGRRTFLKALLTLPAAVAMPAQATEAPLKEVVLPPPSASLYFPRRRTTVYMELLDQYFECRDLKVGFPRPNPFVKHAAEVFLNPRIGFTLLVRVEQIKSLQDAVLVNPRTQDVRLVAGESLEVARIEAFHPVYMNTAITGDSSGVTCVADLEALFVNVRYNEDAIQQLTTF